MMRHHRIIALLVVLAATAAIAAFFQVWARPQTDRPYRTAKVDRGEIVAGVNATGITNPVTTVIVGSQLSGQVVEVLADYNTAVKAGQVIARLNPDQIQARLDAARADLEQMRANKLVEEARIDRVKAEIVRIRAAEADAEAQIARNEAMLKDAEANFQRQSSLREGGRGFTTEAAFGTARAQRDAQAAAVTSAKAQLASVKAQALGLDAELRVVRAQIAAAAAQVAQREAVVRQIEVDLRNTEIRSPVSGVVIQRNIELGQTVAASLQAPTLFLIGDDLRYMEIAASIDETDVGRVRVGQRVTFSVSAYPNRAFVGTVKQVRLGSQMVQNVVIYTAIISVDNSQHQLLPGMTASLRIETDRRENVVRVPNVALRWRPPGVRMDRPVTDRASPSVQSAAASVYVVGPDGQPRQTAIGIGVTDGAVTEAKSGIEAGQEVVVGGGPKARAPASPIVGLRFGS